MKIIKYILIVAAFLIALFFGIGFYFDYTENIYTYYPTLESAKKAGEIGRGWIPEIIPLSATEIHEQYNLDTNEVWVRFSLPLSEKEKVTSGLRKVPQQEIAQIKLRYPWRASSWWFEALIQQAPENDAALYAEIYYAEGRMKNSFFAFDCCSSRVYYWDTGD